MPKIVNSDEKINFICDRAYEEFIKNGVNSFSLNKFIESLNMSKGQFYHYFKNKEELIFEVIDRKSEIFFINAEIRINKAQTFFEKLLALFSFYLDLSDPENKSFDKAGQGGYQEKLQLRIKTLIPLSKRWRIGNVRSSDNKQVYVEIDKIDSPDTFFEVFSSHAVLDPFGKVSYYETIMQRVPVQYNDTIQN